MTFFDRVGTEVLRKNLFEDAERATIFVAYRREFRFIPRALQSSKLESKLDITKSGARILFIISGRVQISSSYHEIRY